CHAAGSRACAPDARTRAPSIAFAARMLVRIVPQPSDFDSISGRVRGRKPHAARYGRLSKRGREGGGKNREPCSSALRGVTLAVWREQPFDLGPLRTTELAWIARIAARG